MRERLSELVDEAVTAGRAHTRVCDLLAVADARVHRWRARLHEHGTLEDRARGGDPVHRLLAWEEAAVLDLIERWGPVDRSHRRPAHRGSCTEAVSVSPSSVLRVAATHGVGLPGGPPRPPRPPRALPQAAWERDRVWIWDSSRFTTARRAECAIVDVVTRCWIGCLLTTETTSTQARLLFALALEDQGLADPAGGLLLGADGQPLERDDDAGPVLVAWSDIHTECAGAWSSPL